MPFRVSRQVAISSKRRAGPDHSSQPASQPAGVKRNHTDLHIMIYIPVLCLFYSSFSHLVSCQPRPPSTSPLPPRRAPPPSCLATRRPAPFCLFFASRSSILLFIPILFCYGLEKCQCTDVSILSSFLLFYIDATYVV